ncbi:MAG: SDR family oxidoreductase [Dehalobacter sp. 4CP]|uniref:SDR family NAD(P)-dependent oxidoreductase n=1 Tax=Dehalobacter sp. CP TaxID=2594474 RepID=UPI0013C9C5A9|nr:SDR family oxidoreductase [Dehalobacter sp. 4CP]
MSSLDGKVAVVTGGARGIGSATCKTLASRGAKVVVNYMSNSSAADQVVADIKAAGGEAVAIKADVRSQEQVEKMITEAKNQFGRIDILVNNASMNFVVKPFLYMSWEEFSQKLNDELQASFVTTKAVIPTMLEQKSGRIVYVSSNMSKVAGPAFIAHGTAKGGLDSFVKYIAQEFGPNGITANVVGPSLIETDGSAGVPDEARKMMIGHTPLRRLGVPQDVAGVIAFLASDDSCYVTGTYIPVSGGQLML